MAEIIRKNDPPEQSCHFCDSAIKLDWNDIFDDEDDEPSYNCPVCSKENYFYSESQDAVASGCGALIAIVIVAAIIGLVKVFS